MIAHVPKTDKHLSAVPFVCAQVVVTLLALCLSGCGDRPALSNHEKSDSSTTVDTRTVPSPSHKPTDALIRAGMHSLTADEFAIAIAEARVLRHWNSGKPAEVDALNSQTFRRKLLIRALETKIVRHEVKARGLTVDSQDHDRLLDQAMLGLAPQGRATGSQRAALPRDPDEIDARLVARYALPAVHVRNAVRDLAEHSALAHALLEETAEERIKASWSERNTCLKLELFRIARVPTSSEISRAVKARQADMPTYYAENPKLFQRKAKVFLRRFKLDFGDERAGMSSDEARARVAAVRQRVEAGADLEQYVRTEGFPRDRRSGGRLSRSRERAPALFEKEAGYLSPIERKGSAWLFYRVEGKAPALDRPLSDPRVQREIAAALLRRDDQLPHARGVAIELTRRLRRGTAPTALAAWLKNQRIRSTETKRFCQSIGDRVPTIGLAPELARVVFELSDENPVSRRVRVRQDYVVARLISRKTTTDAEWTEARLAFMEEWKAERGPKIVREWLNSYLKTSALNLDQARLAALPLERLLRASR